MNIYQCNPGEANTVSVIEVDLCLLETFRQKAKCDFIKLDDNFPKEEEVEKHGLPAESSQQANCARVEDTHCLKGPD